MLNRKILNDLKVWHKNGATKALLLNGARQVGKTTSVRLFSEKHYKNFIEINFVKNPAAIEAFEGTLDTATIITNLSAMGFGPFIKGETLVFFDEIQDCPNARTAIKFLVEEHWFDYIESGSLLGINYKPVKSYPVGYEEEVKVYPMDFEEFLWANNIDESIIDILRQSFLELKPVPEFVHNQIMNLYRTYLVVGGMPEAVQKYVDSRDFTFVNAVQSSILTTYRADISNYAGRQQVIVKRIFDAIPSQLAKENKRFILASLEKGASLKKYEDPTQWLVDTGLTYYSINTSALQLPFNAFENRKLYKLYMVDVGLLSQLLLKGIQIEVLKGNVNINSGAITENFVASVLASKGYDLHYYDRKSRHELDFIIEDNGKITIIEVKSGKDYHRHASLDYALRYHEDKIGKAIVLCTSNIQSDDKVIYMPLYMSMFL